MKLLVLILIIIICLFPSYSDGFVPASLISSTIMVIDRLFFGAFGEVSESRTHEEIIRKGIIQSAVQFFYDQNGSSLVNLTKKSDEYYDLPRLYFDYYNRSICSPALSSLLTVTFSTNVARVDLSSSTKDLPYAHFDAEAFTESNQLVINMTERIYAALNTSDFATARELSGQVMHTIQDYYSHSNHVEMGTTTLNELIGTEQFNMQTFIGENETNACDASNCNLVTIECSTLVSIFSALLSAIGFQSSITTCPLTYYNCTDNILILDKLLSGFYTGQELTDGTPVTKPEGLVKCSHGGILDASSNIPAMGGINKDSGYLVFSPHASLHLTAAALAINHTEFYFNQIRTNIGDAMFDQFLQLTVDEATLAAAPAGVYTCSIARLRYSPSTILISSALSLMYLVH